MRTKKFWNKKNAISILIVLIMVSSGVGMMWGRNSQPTTKYHGYTLIAKDNMWWIKDSEIAFNFHPLDVENITMDTAIKEKLLNTLMIYITFDPENPPEYIDAIRFSIASALQTKGIYAESSITQENENYSLLPTIDCANATQFVPVVNFKFSKTNKTKLTLKDNCIIAQAKDNIDMVKLKDRLLYGLFDIIK